MKLFTGFVVFASVLFGGSRLILAQTSMLDKTFGTNGTMVAFIAGGDSDYDEGYSSAIQTDGKIVVAGWSTDSSTNYAFAVARFNSNGTLDNTFGTNGTARTFIHGGDSTNDKAYSVAIQTDGKIVVAGYSVDTTGGTSYAAFALARFNSNGTLDDAFGTNGTATTFISGGGLLDEGRSVSVQSDGKILVAGLSAVTLTSGGFTFATGSYALGVARFNSNGKIDNTFGTNGSTSISAIGVPLLYYAYSLTIEGDGKIMVAGSSIDPVSGNIGFALARLNSNGAIDNTFGSDGISGTYISGGDSSSDVCNSVAIQPDGKIVVAGSSADTTSLVENIAFAVARFDSNGTLDATFGTHGTVRAYITGGENPYGRADIAYSVAIQTDGKIVVGGTSGFSMQSFALARFNSNGAMDTTFGTGGTVMTNTFSTGDQDLDDEVHSIVIQPDGKIVAAGYSQATFGATDFAVARYLQSNVTGIIEAKSFPRSFSLEQNYPNPFNPSTTINYQLPMNSHVTLNVYDILGREVATLVNEKENAGSYSVKFDGSRLASGVYFYRLTAGSFISVKKLVVLK
ncbi:MAG: T9SS type A sorting domain-containing protein [Candidatus Kryptoniota bacterium]